MILSKNRVLFGFLTALALGFACGYLFSSRFCSISIGRRVEKISSLNQTLRNLFTLRTFYNAELVAAKNWNNSDAQIAQNRLTNVNEQISNIIAQYYDRRAATQLLQGFEGEIDSQQFATLLAQLNPTWATSTQSIQENLNSEKELNAKLQNAFANKNRQQVFDLFEKDLTRAMEFADELDRGITQQFPHKF